MQNRRAVTASPSPAASSRRLGRSPAQRRLEEHLDRLIDPLLAWYAAQRRVLPWRTRRSPYRVVVSEFMLQQTQVERVVPIFTTFVASFPSFRALATADVADVLRAWRGLGYNGRAVRLHGLARVVCSRHAGRMPRDEASIRALPGVGPYTATAIRAFAFDCDEVAFDTNVRRVLRRALYGDRAGSEALEPPVRLLRRGTGNAVNSALMDLGASLCRSRAATCFLCPLVSACAAAPLAPAPRRVERRGGQKPFQETTRFLRGRIVDVLRGLPQGVSVSTKRLHEILARTGVARTLNEVEEAVAALHHEGIIRFDGTRIRL